MPNDEHVAMLGRGAAAWNAWRAEHDEAPDLSRAALRGLDLSGFDLSQAELRGADLRGTQFCDADLSGADLEGANLFKAVLDGADLEGARLYGALFLNCAQLIVARNWQSAFRDEALACGAAIPDRSSRLISIEDSGPTRSQAAIDRGGANSVRPSALAVCGRLLDYGCRVGLPIPLERRRCRALPPCTGETRCSTSISGRPETARRLSFCLRNAGFLTPSSRSISAAVTS